MSRAGDEESSPSSIQRPKLRQDPLLEQLAQVAKEPAHLIDMDLIRKLMTLRFMTDLTETEYQRRRTSIQDAAGYGSAATPQKETWAASNEDPVVRGM